MLTPEGPTKKNITIMILKFGVRHDIQFASEKYSHNTQNNKI